MKYHNQKTTVYGIAFDSKKEAERYLWLRSEEKKGNISNLQTQVVFELIPGMVGEHRREREVKYIADFTYTDRDGKYHVEDAKGLRTKDYIIKRKLMLFRKGISVEEV